MHTYLLVAGGGEIPALLEPFADYGGEGQNPNGKFDWFEIGGRFGAALSLRQPRQVRRFFGLLLGGSTSRATSAKKSEVEQGELVADPPSALLFRGQWSASPPFAEAEAAAKWRAEFARLFTEIP